LNHLVVYFNFADYQNFFIPALQTQNSAKMLAFCPLPHAPKVIFPSPCLLQFETVYLATSLPFPEGRADRAWETAE